MAAMFARRWKIAHPRAVARAMLVIALIVCIFYILVPHSFFIFISGFNDKTQLFHQGLDQRIQTEKVHEKPQQFQIYKVTGNISATSALLQPNHNFHIEQKPLCPLVPTLLGNNLSF